MLPSGNRAALSGSGISKVVEGKDAAQHCLKIKLKLCSSEEEEKYSTAHTLLESYRVTSPQVVTDRSDHTACEKWPVPRHTLEGVPCRL